MVSKAAARRRLFTPLPLLLLPSAARCLPPTGYTGPPLLTRQSVGGVRPAALGLWPRIAGGVMHERGGGRLAISAVLLAAGRWPLLHQGWRLRLMLPSEGAGGVRRRLGAGGASGKHRAGLMAITRGAGWGIELLWRQRLCRLGSRSGCGGAGSSGGGCSSTAWVPAVWLGEYWGQEGTVHPSAIRYDPVPDFPILNQCCEVLAAILLAPHTLSICSPVALLLLLLLLLLQLEIVGGF